MAASFQVFRSLIEHSALQQLLQQHVLPEDLAPAVKVEIVRTTEQTLPLTATCMVLRKRGRHEMALRTCVVPYQGRGFERSVEVVAKTLHEAAGIDQSVDAGLDIHLVLDNYRTHKHPRVNKCLAARPAISRPFHTDEFFVAQSD
jgi:hypothetical protein